MFVVFPAYCHQIFLAFFWNFLPVVWIIYYCTVTLRYWTELYAVIFVYFTIFNLDTVGVLRHTYIPVFICISFYWVMIAWLKWHNLKWQYLFIKMEHYLIGNRFVSHPFMYIPCRKANTIKITTLITSFNIFAL